MIKELIDLQRKSKATCAVISSGEANELHPSVLIKAGDDSFLFAQNKQKLREKIEEISKQGDVCYFIVADIDCVCVESQNRYVGLVKDRELNGLNLPENMVVVFTIKDRNSLTKMSLELYRFAVVAF